MYVFIHSLFFFFNRSILSEMGLYFTDKKPNNIIFAVVTLFHVVYSKENNHLLVFPPY